MSVGVQKHNEKYRENAPDPGPFLASVPPTHHATTGTTCFFLKAAPRRLPAEDYPENIRLRKLIRAKSTYTWNMESRTSNFQPAPGTRTSNLVPSAPAAPPAAAATLRIGVPFLLAW
jgi:hypothetical protein